jgi:hypothetical protein
MSAVSVVLHPGTNCMSPDTSRMVLDAPSNQGAHQGKRAAETQAQQYDEQPEGLEPRMAGIDSVRRPSPSIQVRCSTTKVEVTIDIGTLNLPCAARILRTSPSPVGLPLRSCWPGPMANREVLWRVNGTRGVMVNQMPLSQIAHASAVDRHLGKACYEDADNTASRFALTHVSNVCGLFPVRSSTTLVTLPKLSRPS